MECKEDTNGDMSMERKKEMESQRCHNPYQTTTIASFFPEVYSKHLYVWFLIKGYMGLGQIFFENLATGLCQVLRWELVPRNWEFERVS